MTAPAAAFHPAASGALDAGALFGPFLGRAQAAVAAVSGGSDSLALLLLLNDFRRTAPGLGLTVVTVDHGLRPESAGEARRVAALAARLGLPHRTLRWEGAKPRTGVIAAARGARYRLLAQAAHEAGADTILTGHTADDQFETVSMRIARLKGEEGRGLAGMAPLTLLGGRTWIARPLLNLRREALRRHLRDLAIAWTDDPTNADPRFERARLRLAAPPADGEVERVLRLAADAARDRAATAGRAAALVRAHADQPLPGLFRLAPAFASTFDRSAALALRFLLAVAGGRVHPVEERRAEALLAALREPGRHTLGGAVAERRRDAIFLRREARGIAEVEFEDGAVFDDRYMVRASVEGCEAPPLRLAGASHLSPCPGEGKGAEARQTWLPSSPLSSAGAEVARQTRDAAEASIVDGRLAVETLGTPLVAQGRAVFHAGASSAALPRLHGVPPSLARAAASTQPAFRSPDGRTVPLAEAGLRAEPVVAPFATFLPGFDLPLAKALHALAGASPLPSPPYPAGGGEAA